MENINESVNEVTNNEVVETPVEETSNKGGGFNPNEFKSIMDMIKSMDEQLKYLKDMSEGLVRNNYRLNTSILDDILKYDKKELEVMDLDVIREFLIKYSTSDEVTEEIKSLNEKELRDEIKEIKNSSLVLLSAKTEADKLKEESNTIFSEYMNYVTSDKAREIKKKNLENMKQSLELEKDNTKKAKMEDMIRTIESSLNYDFLYDRFKALGKDEVENIKVAFFNNRRGSYIMDKFYAKMKMFGFKQDLYTYFLNIEETFLDEKYHPFNNLFLFIYARMIAYSDPYNKKDVMFVNAINSGLASLIYHKFESTEQELNFKGIIMGIDDYFMEYRDYFVENNTTYEKHPERIHYESSKEDALKKFYIDKLHSLDINDFDENLSSKELKSIYEEKFNTLVDNQLADYNKEDKEKEAENNKSDEVVEENKDVIEENNEVDDNTTGRGMTRPYILRTDNEEEIKEEITEEEKE